MCHPSLFSQWPEPPKCELHSGSSETSQRLQPLFIIQSIAFGLVYSIQLKGKAFILELVRTLIFPF